MENSSHQGAGVWLKDKWLGGGGKGMKEMSGRANN